MALHRRVGVAQRKEFHKARSLQTILVVLNCKHTALAYLWRYLITSLSKVCTSKQHNDCQRAGPSGDRIAVVAKFSTIAHSVPGVKLPSFTMDN